MSEEDAGHRYRVTVDASPRLLKTARELLALAGTGTPGGMQVAPACAVVIAAVALESSIDGALHWAMRWEDEEASSEAELTRRNEFRAALAASLRWKMLNVPGLISGERGIVHDPRVALSTLHQLIDARNALVHARGEVVRGGSLDPSHSADLGETGWDEQTGDLTLSPEAVEAARLGRSVPLDESHWALVIDLDKAWGMRWFQFAADQAMKFVQAVEQYRLICLGGDCDS